MSQFSRFFAMFSLAAALVVGVLLPGNAQDAKDEPKKEEPKKKIVRVPEDVVLRGLVMKGKVKDIRDDEKGREVIFFTVDPEKLNVFQKWDLQQQNAVRTANSPQAQAERVKAYKGAYLKHLDEIFVGDLKSVLLTDAMYVRTANPPANYDAAGNLKPHTAAQLAKLKGGSRLPGYSGTGDSLKIGQIVDIYSPKPGPMPKVITPPKKDFIGVDPSLVREAIPRVPAYMIYVAVENH